VFEYVDFNNMASRLVGFGFTTQHQHVLLMPPMLPMRLPVGEGKGYDALVCNSPSILVIRHIRDYSDIPGPQNGTAAALGQKEFPNIEERDLIVMALPLISEQ
jgi:hypothetical protein